jgi:hypothetical protein
MPPIIAALMEAGSGPIFRNGDLALLRFARKSVTYAR